VAMCDGDPDAALELAIGPPRVPGGARQKNLQERMAEALGGDDEPSEQELQEIGREIDARHERVGRIGVAKASRDYSIAAHRWLTGHDRLRSHTDPAVCDAIAVIGWDAHFIRAKIARALNGRDEDPLGRFWRSRVQNDWNGSAKVALISIE